MSLDRPLFLRAILSYLLRFFGLVFGEYYNTTVDKKLNVYKSQFYRHFGKN
ncbi:hypothetical protein ENHY17A_500013 [Moraxellaceae bacterium 17A]|nr:hypothetical protein ENHY17A_500013 [Moraxellaceae bacterium 17A]